MEDQERQSHPSGFVYILSNQAFEGLLKIGETSISPYQRAKELQGTGVPRPFIVERAFYVKDRQASERLVHEVLSRCRLEDNREFFETNVLTAVAMAEVILRDKGQLDDRVWPNTERETELDEEVKSLEERIEELETALNSTREANAELTKEVAEKEDEIKRSVKAATGIRERQKAELQRETDRAERAEEKVRELHGEDAYQELQSIKRSKWKEFKKTNPYSTDR